MHVVSLAPDAVHTPLAIGGMPIRPSVGTDAPAGAPSGRRDRHLPGHQVGKLVRFIDDNLDRPLLVGELAHLSGLSQSYFSRSFKGWFGLSPHAYVMTRRVERAKAALLRTDDAICDIALVCGLADQAHLTRTFRRQVGMPPGAWRRLQRAG